MRSTLLLALLAAAACSAPPAADAPDMADPRYWPDAPPAQCRTPSAPAAPWYHEVTAEVGLAPTQTLIPLGTNVAAADFDGDGYPDFVSDAGGDRETAATPPDMRRRFLFLNRDDGSGRRVFVDATAESGILATRDGKGGRIIGGVYPGDLDGDGDVDLVLCNGYVDSDQLADACDAFLNDGAAHFTMAPSSGLDQAGPFWPTGGGLLDFDRDGLVDFFPGTMAHWPNGPNVPDVGPKLFRGDGRGGFTDVAAAVGLLRDDGDPAQNQNWPAAISSTVCDLDGDGADDLLYATYGRQYNQVFLNQGGKFVESALALGVAADDRIDFSDDESYRCYCAAHAGKCSPDVPAPNQFIACPDRGWYPGYSDQKEHLGGNTFGIACGDLDDDGDVDLMLATIRHGDVGASSDPSEILLDDTPAGAPLGKYRRPGNDAMGIARAHTGIFWNEGDMTPVFADFDLDGRKDIYLASSDYPTSQYATTTHGWMWRQKPDGTFADVTDRASTGQVSIQGIAFVDIDGDGDLDLIGGSSTFRNTTREGVPIQGAPTTNTLHVYRNDVGQASNFVAVRLVGGGAGRANRPGYGARVRVTAGGRTQSQEVTSARPELLFGLGATCAVDAIEVRWPDGSNTVETFHDVVPNYHVELRQGDATVRYLR